MNDKIIKKIIFIIGSCIVILSFILVVVLCVLFGNITTESEWQKESIKNFNKNEETVNSIVDYMLNSPYDNIRITLIPSWDGTMYTGLENGSIKISDINIIEALRTLQKRHYEIIQKQENVIYFQNYSTMDKGCGVVYSSNEDNIKKRNSYITQIISIGIENWYYYKEE